MPVFTISSIAISAIGIDDDLPAYLADEPFDAETLALVRRFGQIVPLLVRQTTAASWTLLGTMPHYNVLRHLGEQEALCHILPQEVDPFTHLSLQFLHHRGAGQTSPVLEAHLLRRAQRLLSKDEQLLLLGVMGCKPNLSLIREKTECLALAPSAVSALHRGELSSKTVRKLGTLHLDDQHALVELITRFRPSSGKQQKLIDMVTELRQRSALSARTIIESWQQQAASSDNRPQQFALLLSDLEERCSPQVAQAKKRFNHERHELDLPSWIDLRHSLSFEEDTVELCLRFPDLKALKTRWEVLKNALT